MTFEEELAKSGRLIYTNKGISMMPLLREKRDVMIIEKCSPCDIKRLDAVLFMRMTGDEKAYVMHRVLRLEPDGSFFIAGDNCISGENVRPEMILGRLTGVIRDGKRIDVKSKRYLFYVHLWCDIYPLRFLILRFRNFSIRCLRYAKRRIKHEG